MDYQKGGPKQFSGPPCFTQAADYLDSDCLWLFRYSLNLSMVRTSISTSSYLTFADSGTTVLDFGLAAGTLYTPP